ncbi:MAG: TldD/PmbA family protein [Chloroflexi bacterium]|nr:TldD/PmbA family protein [Chloroflexota bacterium]MBU1746686.1 TldD/PmbA family protein [Chloroflexota bacterium]MBU1878334.1 TldD/PmbA family protein [Chloroflexota bacterium]
MNLLDQLAGRADQAEAFTIREETTIVGFKANDLRSAEVSESSGASLRVLVDGRLGFAGTTASGPEAHAQLVENVLASAAYGDEIPLVFPASQPSTPVQVYDADLAALSIPRLVELGREIIDIIRQAEPDVHVEIDLRREVGQWEVCNTTGLRVGDERSTLSVNVTAERVREDDILIVFDYFSTVTLAEGDTPLDFARDIAQRLKLARRDAQLTSGAMPVLFSPRGAVVLALPLSPALSGKNVLHGVSPLAGRVGEPMFDRRLTVVDDGTLNGRPGSASHDDEGVPHRRYTLIEDGVLRGFLYDLKTAAQSGPGVTSTGHGARGIFSPPSPAATNTLFAGGDTALSDILAQMDRGLLVESALGLGQGNILSGAFSNTLGLAYAVEHGEIIGRVKDVSIAGNIYQDLQHIQDISREGAWVYGSTWLPFILLAELNVSTKG